MITISKTANLNYLAKVIKLKNVKKHPNADRLQTVNIDFQNVITGMDAKDGDIYVFFPVESQINLDFLAATNSFRHAELNSDKEKVGFFEDKGRVKAMKLRGEKSMGYIVPIKVVEDFSGKELSEYVGQEFDTIGDVLMVKKYIIPRNLPGSGNKQGRKPRISRMIDGQIHLHADTSNLRKEAYKIKPDDIITITYKYHGTSFWVSNVMVKRKLKLYEKILKKFGVKIDDKEYDYVYGSRKVVKNEFETEGKSHFYDYDLWGDIKEELKDSIPKGYTLYGECVGYLKTGKPIQSQYTYGCREGEKKIIIYRITFTNADGTVQELSYPQMVEYCNYFGLNFVHVCYWGEAKWVDKDLNSDADDFTALFVNCLEKKYNDKDCFICNTGVPEEGVVIRKDRLFSYEAYKLKSFRFLEFETKLLDEGAEDIEEQI